MNIQTILDACLEAVLFGERDLNNAEDGDTHLDSAGFSVADFTPEAVTVLRAELTAWVWQNRRMLRAFRELGHDDRQIGHDYYFTTAGHGVGFWDRGAGDVGDALSDACVRREWCVYSLDDGCKLTFN